MHLCTVRRMTVKEISQAAAKLEKPDKMNLIEMQLYYTLAAIYTGFRQGTSSEEDGRAAKAEAVQAFEQHIKDLTVLKLLRRSVPEAVKAAEEVVR